MYGEMNNPMEIIIEEDPRLKYRQFDESLLEEERSIFSAIASFSSNRLP